MPEGDEQPFEDFLKLYDGLRKDDFNSRRLAYKPLYDFFRRVLILARSKLCGLPENSLKIPSVKTTWAQVKACLAVVNGRYSEWDELISNVQNVRERVEPDLDYDPPLRNLEGLREAAPEFRHWILETGMRVLKESRGFTWKDHYFRSLEYYVNTAKQPGGRQPSRSDPSR